MHQESAIPSVVEMEFLNLSEGTYFNKIQSRKGGTPKQVLENAVIEMKATYGPEPLLCIKGWIRREPEAARLCGDANHDVLLCQAAGRELNLVEKNNIPVPAIDPRYMSVSVRTKLAQTCKNWLKPQNFWFLLGANKN